ncbi:hypothetical protein DDB_G0290907 [Dictyostelium discoideum AX4]|uniref:Putative uncharacterized protein DDB_G0290907 n=1 Tax=Dictyostelium discoideum TaxID=44689 RepID=Y9145_DICDI|nr:hypothetical protein DDB_G0290907 [Dictyostelium discoideum AX4]Q54FE9.1 RecName: Full=Putative uncharacterized protein DDB_G0290907 [Dictyostelium discoideum]EAL61969.1 hypothetical protein DDB_G0290907 [Dictyostelium discoideum AX4]|eukprot:XP_635473.1 hypothetical protein DDB_G0290907 [Dictyostelium discoideum AX4]
MIIDSITKLNFKNKSSSSSVITVKTSTSPQIIFGDNKFTGGVNKQKGFDSVSPTLKGKGILFV